MRYKLFLRVDVLTMVLFVLLVVSFLVMVACSNGTKIEGIVAEKYQCHGTCVLAILIPVEEVKIEVTQRVYDKATLSWWCKFEASNKKRVGRFEGQPVYDKVSCWNE